MADANHYLEIAAGLEAAAKAARACAQEESGEDESSEKDTPKDDQPKTLRDAGDETRKRAGGKGIARSDSYK